MKYLFFLFLFGCTQIEDVKNIRFRYSGDQPIIGYQIKTKSSKALEADHRWKPTESEEYNLEDLGILK